MAQLTPHLMSLYSRSAPVHKGGPSGQVEPAILMGKFWGRRLEKEGFAALGGRRQRETGAFVKL